VFFKLYRPKCAVAKAVKCQNTLKLPRLWHSCHYSIRPTAAPMPPELLKIQYTSRPGVVFYSLSPRRSRECEIRGSDT